VFVVKDAVREPLYAIVPYFNPWRWKSREKHTLRAIKHFHDSGAVVVLVEAAFNRREFTLADCGLDGTPASCGVLGTDHNFRHMYIPLRTKDELWIKENLINLGISRLPHSWQQVCWLDSDIYFIRPNWVGECIHKLQHFAFLQMFSQARDVGPNSELLPLDYIHSSGPSFIHAWSTTGLTDKSLQPVKEKQKKCDDSYGLAYGVKVWPGLAWAATHEAIDKVGGLIDVAFWGGGDWHMAHALIGKAEWMMRPDLHRNYKKIIMQWFYRCQTHIRRNVGSMEGAIIHRWHGKKEHRGYNDKHAILARIGFDPLRHLKRDFQGIWELHDDGTEAFPKLRDFMRRIARERNEDSIDL